MSILSFLKRKPRVQELPVYEPPVFKFPVEVAPVEELPVEKAEKPVKFSIRGRGIKLVRVLVKRLHISEQKLRKFLSKLSGELQNEVAELFEESHSLRMDFEERKAYEVENLSPLEQVVTGIEAPGTGGHNCLRLEGKQKCIFHLYADEVARVGSLSLLKIREVR